MKLIVGLGNPGKEYEKTRHNVGFMVIDNYLKNESFKQKFNGLYAKKIINDVTVIFLKPTSYMNLSGIVVQKYKKFFKIKNEEILIIHDDLDIELGKSKLKYSSSSGGNNGVKSIIKELGTKDFGQYKIGVSKPKYEDTKNYVLSKFSLKEQEIINKKIDESVRIIDYYINNDIHKTINKFNGEIK